MNLPSFPQEAFTLSENKPAFLALPSNVLLPLHTLLEEQSKKEEKSDVPLKKEETKEETKEEKEETKEEKEAKTRPTPTTTNTTADNVEESIDLAIYEKADEQDLIDDDGDDTDTSEGSLVEFVQHDDENDSDSDWNPDGNNNDEEREEEDEEDEEDEEEQHQDVVHKSESPGISTTEPPAALSFDIPHKRPRKKRRFYHEEDLDDLKALQEEATNFVNFGSYSRRSQQLGGNEEK